MKTKFLSVLALGAILFAACSSDDENNAPEVNGVQVKFSSGIRASGMLKVGGPGGNQWEGNEYIGIYMLKNGTTDVAESAENKCYGTTSTGASATFSPLVSSYTIYYPVDITQKVDFIAYHPYNTNMNGYVYPVDLSNQSDQSKIDLMAAGTSASTPGGFDKTNTNSVDLKFEHQLAKLVMNVVAGDGVENLGSPQVRIKGMNTTADFSIINPGFTNEGTPADITACNAGNYQYEAILLPVALGSSQIVEFTIGGNTYKWTMSDNSNGILSLDAGSKYTFTITVQKNTLQVEGTINEWTLGGSTTGIAN